MLIGVFGVEARWMHFRVVLLIEGEIIDSLQNVSLAQVNQSLYVVNQSLVLDAGWLLDLLLDLDGILVDLGPQLCCDFNLLVRLGNIVLNYQEHSLIALEQYLILMNVHILGGHRMLPYICRIDNAEAILYKHCLIKHFTVLLACTLLLLCCLSGYGVLGRKNPNVLFLLEDLIGLLELNLDGGNHRPCASRLLELKQDLQE